MALAAARLSSGRFVAVLGSAVCLFSPAAAQVSIRVIDASRVPIPAVRVDVYGRGELLETVATSGRGVAELSAERWFEARRLSLSHLGYQALIVQVEDVPVDGVIVIEPEAIPIEALSVAVGQLCPIVDQPDARRLWSQIASLYASDTGSRASFAYLSLHRGSVSEGELHRTGGVDLLDGVTNGAWGPLVGAELADLSLDARIEKAGYTWPPFTIDGATLHTNGWGYPPLHMRAAHHFASPVFGALHDFAMMSESEQRTTLIFCGKGRASGATINGTITIVPGRAFVDAEWRFETDDPDEGAGGSVTFGTFVDRAGTRPHLVSSSGIFYRHSGIELPYPNLPRTYEREITANVRWYLLPSGETPCIGNVSFPAAADPRLLACIERHWGRE